LKNLTILDDEDILPKGNVQKKKQTKTDEYQEDDENKSISYHQCPFDDDWQLINQCLDEGVYPAEEKLAINGLAFSFSCVIPNANISPVSHG
jgi:hypothetical protein